MEPPIRAIDFVHSFDAFYKHVLDAVFEANDEEEMYAHTEILIKNRYTKLSYQDLAAIQKGAEVYKPEDREELLSDAYRLAIMISNVLPFLKAELDEKRVEKLIKIGNIDEADELASSIEEPIIRPHALAIAIRAYINSDNFNSFVAWAKINGMPPSQDKDALIEDLKDYEARSTTPNP